MSVATKAVRSAAWMLVTGLTANAIGVIGNVVITRYVIKTEYGAATSAAILAGMITMGTSFGIGQYVVVKTRSRPELAWQATITYVGIGAIGLAMLFLFRMPIVHALHAPEIAFFLPGLILSAFIERVTMMPERVLNRDMRFRGVGIARAAGEFSYAVVTVVSAILGAGGQSIVFGNIARSVMRALIIMPSAGFSNWLRPAPFDRQAFREMFGFGTPIGLAGAAAYSARKFDNLLITRLFGLDTAAMYNAAYNFAETPAGLIGDSIGDVLLPSFVNIEPEKRATAFVKAQAVLALIAFPLLIGLGAVGTTVIQLVLPKSWADAGPMLVILSAMSVTKPLTWTTTAFLQSRERPMAFLVLELLNVVAIVTLIMTLGQLGPLWACAAVGLAYLVRAAAGIWVTHKGDPLPLGEFLMGQLRPALACVPMVAAVVLARPYLIGTGMPIGIRLIFEVLIGAIVYIPAALFFAKEVAFDSLAILKRMRKRGG